MPKNQQVNHTQFSMSSIAPLPLLPGIRVLGGGHSRGSQIEFYHLNMGQHQPFPWTLSFSKPWAAAALHEGGLGHGWFLPRQWWPARLLNVVVSRSTGQYGAGGMPGNTCHRENCRADGIRADNLMTSPLPATHRPGWHLHEPPCACEGWR